MTIRFRLGPFLDDRAGRGQSDDRGARNRPFGAIAGASSAGRAGAERDPDLDRSPQGEGGDRPRVRACREGPAPGRRRRRRLGAGGDGLALGRRFSGHLPQRDHLCRHPAPARWVDADRRRGRRARRLCRRGRGEPRRPQARAKRPLLLAPAAATLRSRPSHVLLCAERRIGPRTSVELRSSNREDPQVKKISGRNYLPPTTWQFILADQPPRRSAIHRRQPELFQVIVIGRDAEMVLNQSLYGRGTIVTEPLISALHFPRASATSPPQAPRAVADHLLTASESPGPGAPVDGCPSLRDSRRPSRFPAPTARG